MTEIGPIFLPISCVLHPMGYRIRRLVTLSWIKRKICLWFWFISIYLWAFGTGISHSQNCPIVTFRCVPFRRTLCVQYGRFFRDFHLACIHVYSASQIKKTWRRDRRIFMIKCWKLRPKGLAWKKQNKKKTIRNTILPKCY